MTGVEVGDQPRKSVDAASRALVKPKPVDYLRKGREEQRESIKDYI